MPVSCSWLLRLFYHHVGGNLNRVVQHDVQSKEAHVNDERKADRSRETEAYAYAHTVYFEAAKDAMCDVFGSIDACMTRELDLDEAEKR